MYPVAVAEVARALGGPAVLGEAVEDFQGLCSAIGRGFPRAVVREIAQHATTDKAVQVRIEALVASPSTLKRSPRLSTEASGRAERLARVIALAERSLGSPEEAQEWLTEKHVLFGTRPILYAGTELCARMVERILLNIEYSLPL